MDRRNNYPRRPNIRSAARPSYDGRPLPAEVYYRRRRLAALFALLEVPVVSGLALDGYGEGYRPVGGPEFGPEFRSRQSASGDFTWAKNFVLT